MRRLTRYSVLFVALLAAATSTAQSADVECLIADIWRKPIPGAEVFQGDHLRPNVNPVARSDASGRCMVPMKAGAPLTVNHPDYAPRVLHPVAYDLERGHLVVTLFEGGYLSGTAGTEKHPVETDYVLLRYIDPGIYGGVLAARSDEEGRFRMGHLPEGGAFLTVGMRNDGVVRSATRFLTLRSGHRNYLQFPFRPGKVAVSGQVTGARAATAAISGSVIKNDRSEDFRREADDTGRFIFPGLPRGDATFRAELPDGSIKRVDALLEGDEAQVMIDFAQGVEVDCASWNTPPGSTVTVVALDGHLPDARLQRLLDPTLLIQAARVARRNAPAEARLPALSPGAYTFVALASDPARPQPTLSHAERLDLGEDPVSLELNFGTRTDDSN